MNKTRKQAILLTVTSLLLCICMCMQSSAAVNETERNTDTSETVRVAVVDYPNYLNVESDGSVSGYAFEYLQDIARFTNWSYEYVEMSFADACTALTDGDIDILAGNQYTDERAELWDFSTRDMGEGGTVLCVLPEDRRFSFNDFSSYDGLKIAVLRGSVRMQQAEMKLAEYGSHAEFIQYDTDEDSKEAMEQGKVDAVLMSSIRCESKYRILARISTAPLYFCTNRQKPELKRQLDEAMEKIHLESPYYEEALDDKYYGDVTIQLAYTKDELDYIQSAGEIKIAVATDLAPVEYYDRADGTYKGIVVDSFHLIEEDTGLHFKFVPRTDSADMKQKLQDGEVQALASVVDDPAIGEKWGVSLTGAYYDNNITLVVNRDVSDYMNNNSSLVLRKGYPLLDKIATSRGYDNISYADSFKECIDMVNEKTADITLIPSNSVDRLVKHMEYSVLNTYTMPDTYSEFCIGVSKTANPLLMSILNKSMCIFNKEKRTDLLVQNLASDDEVTLRDYFEQHRFQLMIIALAVATLLIAAASYMAISRSRSNRKLRAAIAQADAANRAKSDFLARMSHDMRTPMNGILGLSYLMEEQKSPEEKEKNIAQLRESGEYLLQLINDVLDMNKIESGNISLHPTRCDEEKLFDSVIELIQPLYKQKEIDFQFKKTNIEWKYMMVDEQRVKQIFINLLSNAVKYTPKGGRVDFSMELISEEEGMIYDRFVIRDNGIGISEAFLPHLFEPFEQEGRIKNDIANGSGLGLTIVKRLVELMDGRISVKSKLNEGTEVTVYLNFPLAEEPEAEAKTTVKTKEKTEQTEKTEKHVGKLEGAQVLLCEDHPLNAKIAIRLLEKKGIHVTWVENGWLGIDAFEKSEGAYYDAVLMDIRMPVMNGLEATRGIRALERPDAKNVPIIAMTANAFEEDRKASKEAGMNEHLAKPIEPELLYHTLEKWIVRENKKDEFFRETN